MLIITNCDLSIALFNRLKQKLEFEENDLTIAFVFIKELFRLELEILLNLFKAQNAISDLKTLESTLSLKYCKDLIGNLKEHIDIKVLHSILNVYFLDDD